MKFIFFFTIVSALTVSCCKKDGSESRMRPTYNNGGYTLDTTTTKQTKSVIISGALIDTETKEPITFGSVWDGCSNYSVDSTGSYELSSTAYDNFRLIARATGYRDVETQPIAIKSGDLVRIDFYLIQNDQPLIDCTTSSPKN